jgi:WD40 repeat protein
MITSNRLVISFYVCMLLSAGACEETKLPETTKEAIVEESQSVETQQKADITQVVDESDQINLEKQQVISAENVEKLTLLKNIYPFFPPVIQLSSDGNTVAVGTLAGVKVIDLISYEILLEIFSPVLTCNFGFRKTFRLNQDGSYLVIALEDKIEVWKVGEGLIYESTYKNSFVLDPLTCGGDIPQLALSPDGKFLVESGVYYSSNEMESYFRITDLEAKTIHYEWEGSDDTLHGQFYAFPGMGFSSDGTVLQTFDPTRYSSVGEKYNYPFRFWSTSDWQELLPNSKIVNNAFFKGEFLFTRSDNNSVHIFDKRTGEELRSISIAGCIKENPCDVAFSLDGTKMVYRHINYGQSFKRISTSAMASTYDILSEEKLLDYPIQSRNSEEFYISNDGKLLYFDGLPSDNSDWWTQTEYFSGFRVIDDLSIAFTPQVVIKDKQQQEPYSISCQIHLDSHTVDCSNSLKFENGFSVGLERKDEGISVIDTSDTIHESIADIRYPQGGENEYWQFRLSMFSGETETGFFCVDRNFRKDSCFIIDLVKNEILYDLIDITGVQYSTANQTAIFINQDEKALYLFFDGNNSLKRMKSYQALALPIKPAYLSDGIEFIYFVQSLENKNNVYIEKIDSEKRKVIKRYDIEELKNKEIRAIAVSPMEDIWAVADQSGSIFFVDPERQVVFFSFQALKEEVVDMILSPDGKSVITIGKSGVISIWIVKK